MSLTKDIEKDSRIYGESPAKPLTDVASNGNDINPETANTVINDNAFPTSVNLPGARNTGSKNVKLLADLGADINTIAGTIVMDPANTTVDLLYDSNTNTWVSDPTGMVIPATQKRGFINGSESAASAANIGFVDQGRKNSLAISADGKTLASGGPGFGVEAANEGSGIIWVYERDGFDWVEKYQLSSSLGRQGFFGAGVAINDDGTIIAGGAGRYQPTVTDPIGAVLVYEKQDSGGWLETAQIIPATTPGEAPFGVPVELSGDGNTLVVGMTSGEPNHERGSFWIYTRNTSTSAWTLLSELTESNGTDDYGFAVDISADAKTIVASAPQFPGGGLTRSGAISTWIKTEVALPEISTITIQDFYKITGGEYFLLRSGNDGTTYYVWMDVNGDGTTQDPGVAGATGIQVNVSTVTVANDAEVARLTAVAIAAVSGGFVFSATSSGAVVTVTNLDDGPTTDISDSTISPGFAIETTQRSVAVAGSMIVDTAGFPTSGITDGSYFKLVHTYGSSAITHNIWMDTDGSGTPLPTTLGTNVQVDLSAAVTAEDVASAINTAISGITSYYTSAISSYSNTVIEISTTSNQPSAVSIADSATPTGFILLDTEPASTLEEITAITTFPKSSITDGSYFVINAAADATTYNVWMDVNGDGSPVPAGPNTPVRIDLSAATTAAEVAATIVADMNTFFGFAILVALVSDTGSTIIIRTVGAASGTTDTVDGATPTGFTINTAVQGHGAIEITTVDTTGTYNVIPASSYFLFYTTTTTYYVWMDTTGSDTDPAIGGATGIQVDISSDASDSAIATSIDTAITGSAAAVTVSRVDEVVTITTTVAGAVSASKDTSTGAALAVSQQGAAAGGYSTPVARIEGDVASGQLGLDLAINVDGTVLIATNTDGTRIYTRTTGDWSQTATLLPNGTATGADSVSLNAKGNVAVIGTPFYPTDNGSAYTFANTTGTWVQKAGPLISEDYTVGDDYVFLGGEGLGSGVTISGAGNIAIVGGVSAYLVEFGIQAVYTIETNAATPPVSSSFDLISPVDSSNHVFWFDTTGSDVAPVVVGKTLHRIDVSAISFPDTTGATAQLITQSINTETGTLFTASVSGTTLVTIIVTDPGDSDILDGLSSAATGFTFVTTTAGVDPPLTGALWPFA